MTLTRFGNLSFYALRNLESLNILQTKTNFDN